MAKWFFKPHRGSLIDAMKDTVEAPNFDGVLDKVTEWMWPCDKSICRQDIRVCGERLSDARCGIKLMFRVDVVHRVPKPDDPNRIEQYPIGHIFCGDDCNFEQWNLYMKECENVGR